MAGSTGPTSYLRKVSAIVPTAHGRGSTISARSVGASRDDAGAELHLAVREGRTVLDDQHAFARDRHRRRRRSPGSFALTTVASGLTWPIVSVSAVTCSGRRRVDLVDHDHVGHAQVGLARVVGRLVAGPERVGHDDVHVGR